MKVARLRLQTSQNEKVQVFQNGSPVTEAGMVSLVCAERTLDGNKLPWLEGGRDVRDWRCGAMRCTGYGGG
jgi:hypothetical protein